MNHAALTSERRTDDYERRRQDAVRAYGLDGREVAAPTDPDLRRLAALAAKLTGADHAAVNVIDGGRQVSIASTSSATVTALPRLGAFCTNAVDVRGGAVVVTPDASRDPEFSWMPVVNGSIASVRFYAGVPLVAEDGLALGAVCVYSMAAVSPEVADNAAILLSPIRDAAMEILGERRAASSVAVLRPAFARKAARTAGGTAAEPAAARSPIDAVIDDCDLRTDFQPIVELESDAVVGFRGVARGPAGNELDTPAQLVAAARAAGRLGELDWLCRASAFDAALRSGLPSELTWLVDLEPAGSETECPPHLRETCETAQQQLRVVVALGDDDLETYLPRLITAADAARADGWGVAMNNVGERPASLGLLPFFQPDLVKVDLAALHHLPGPRLADIAAAVRGYIERTGAEILAEGIDTPELRRLAVILGARYGQGLLFGAPGALPASLVPGPPIEMRQQPAGSCSRQRTPMDVLADHAPVQRALRKDLEDLFRRLLRECRSAGSSAALMAVMHSDEHFQQRQHLYTAAGDAAAFAICLVPGGTRRSQTGAMRFQPIADGSALEGQTGIAVMTPHYAGALFVRPLQEDALAPEGEVEFIFTQGRAAVKAACRAITGWVPGRSETFPSDVARQRSQRLTFVGPRPTAPHRTPRLRVASPFKDVFVDAIQALLDVRREIDVIRVTRDLVERLGATITTTPADPAAALPLGVALDGEPLFVEPGPDPDQRDALVEWLPGYLHEAGSVMEFLTETFQRSRPVVGHVA